MKDKHKIYLLMLARREIAENIGIQWSSYRGGKVDTSRSEMNEIKEIRGTFVTLKIDDSLRGCIGRIIPEDPIIKTVKDNAVSAALHDPRFPPLTAEEFQDVDIEISVLSKPEALKYKGADDLLNKIEKGKHGVIIRSGSHSATFLPQVWEDIKTKEEFLSHLCTKARLFPDEWKNGKLIVSVYTAQHFNEKELDLSV